MSNISWILILNLFWPCRFLTYKYQNNLYVFKTLHSFLQFSYDEHQYFWIILYSVVLLINEIAINKI